MAKIDRQISAHNSEMQNLRCRDRFRLSDFLKGASGNFMIAGGGKDRRREVLLKQVDYYRNASNTSVVIFSDDNMLKSQLIDEAERGLIGQLYIVSAEYNNYDFFYDMPLNLVAEYFGKAALLRGNRDTAKLLTFTDAFLRIMSDDGAVNMSVMRDRLENDNHTIRDAASRSDLRDMIVSASDGASLLRDLMAATSDAFSPLTTPDCSSRLNLTSMIDEDCVFLIDIPKENHDLYAEYFALVLRGVMNKSFNLILDDEIILNNKDFFDVVELLKQRYSIDVILSYENIIALQPADADILKNINRQIVFLKGNSPGVDIQTILSRYGQFTALKAFEHRDAPPAYLFTLLRGKGEAATPYQRDRVMLQDLNAEAILSRGSDSEVFAVRRLIL